MATISSEWYFCTLVNVPRNMSIFSNYIMQPLRSAKLRVGVGRLSKSMSAGHSGDETETQEIMSQKCIENMYFRTIFLRQLIYTVGYKYLFWPNRPAKCELMQDISKLRLQTGFERNNWR